MLKCSLPLSLFACLILSGVASSDPIAFSAAIDYENLAARYESMPPEVLSLPSPFMQLRPIAAIKSCETDQSHVQCSVELSTERPLPNCATPCVIARGKFNIQTTATVSNSEALLRNTAEVASIDLADIGSGMPNTLSPLLAEALTGVFSESYVVRPQQLIPPGSAVFEVVHLAVRHSDTGLLWGLAEGDLLTDQSETDQHGLHVSYRLISRAPVATQRGFFSDLAKTVFTKENVGKFARIAADALAEKDDGDNNSLARAGQVAEFVATVLEDKPKETAPITDTASTGTATSGTVTAGSAVLVPAQSTVTSGTGTATSGTLIAGSAVMVPARPIRHPSAQQPWIQVNGSATDLSVATDGTVWAVAPGSSGGIYRLPRDGVSWQAIPGSARAIAVGPAGVVWMVGLDDAPNKWLGSSWQRIDGRAIDVGVGADGTVWIVDGHSAARLEGNGFVTHHGTSAMRIAVGPSGAAWVINREGEVYSFSNPRTGWKKVNTSLVPLNDIGVGGNGEIWVTTRDQRIARLNETWQVYPGNAFTIAVDSYGEAWVTNNQGGIFRTSCSVSGFGASQPVMHVSQDCLKQQQTGYFIYDNANRQLRYANDAWTGGNPWGLEGDVCLAEDGNLLGLELCTSEATRTWLLKAGTIRLVTGRSCLGMAGASRVELLPCQDPRAAIWGLN